VDADAQLLPLNDRPALVAGLGNHGELAAGQPFPPGLDEVEVGVGSDHAHRPAGDIGQAPLRLVARVGTELGEAGREHDREAHALLDAVFQHGQRVADEHDGQVDLVGDVQHAAVRGRSVDGGFAGVDRVDGVGASGEETLPGLAPLRPLRAALGVRGADDRDGPWGEQGSPVNGTQRDGAPAHVQRGPGVVG
jgi:hypothetical protein